MEGVHHGVVDATEAEDEGVGVGEHGPLGRVDDAVFAALREHLTDEQIMEFTYITMMYTMHAVICRALRLEYDDRDDPIVEIAAPADYVPQNLGRQIAYGMDKAEAEAKD